MNHKLEMKEITKSFPGVKALDNVTFYADGGEVLALCGENGAGKSTLMKVLSGSYPKGSYDGEIYIDGELQNFSSSFVSEKAGIAMIYQEISMHLDLSVAENLFLGRWPMKSNKHAIDWKKMVEQSNYYLEQVGLTHIDPTITLRHLSTSQQQLVSIARALSKSPHILVLDEPTSALTNIEAANLFKIVQKLKSQSITSILITHRLDEMFEQADRIIVLRDGKTVGSYSVDDVDRDRIVTDMVGREISSYYPKVEVPIGEVLLEAKDFTVPHPFSPNLNVVSNVSLKVRKGEILGLAGLVGAGRSEMLEAIFGIREKTSGEVFIEGKKVNIKCAKDSINLGIGLLSEERKKDGIIEILSVKDNMTLASLSELSTNKIQKMNHEKEVEVTNTYVKELNIKTPSINTLIQNLSGGNQQKVVLAKWLMTHPRILFLDEPTRGIDVGAKAEIYMIMTDLVRKGIAIIMISSELPVLLSMSDRIMVLSEGHVTGEFNAKTTNQKEIMEAAIKKI